MPTIARFEGFDAWQTARSLSKRIYAQTNEGAWSRDYGLRDQIRRSAVSIMSNIAEGFEIGAPAQFLRFLGYAKGSAGEVRAQLYVALDAGYLADPAFRELIDLAEKCSSQISRLMTYLKAHDTSRRMGEDSAVYEPNVGVDTVD